MRIPSDPGGSRRVRWFIKVFGWIPRYSATSAAVSSFLMPGAPNARYARVPVRSWAASQRSRSLLRYLTLRWPILR